MITINTFRKLALSFPETNEQPHFEKTSFRVGKKIFATLDVKKDQACLKLSENDQFAFCAFDRTIIFPVPNKWGLQGWTFIDLKKVSKKILSDAIKAACNEVSLKKLSKKKELKIVNEKDQSVSDGSMRQ